MKHLQNLPSPCSQFLHAEDRGSNVGGVRGREGSFCTSFIILCYYYHFNMTQSQLVCSFQSQGVSKILRACRNFGKVNGLDRVN